MHPGESFVELLTGLMDAGQTNRVVWSNLPPEETRGPEVSTIEAKRSRWCYANNTLTTTMKRAEFLVNRDLIIQKLADEASS
jgi:hypothetical protein